MSLALDRYSGRTMLFGAVSTALPKLHEYAEGLGLSILSSLLTPFRDSDLHDPLVEFLPVPAPPQIESVHRRPAAGLIFTEAELPFVSPTP